MCKRTCLTKMENLVKRYAANKDNFYSYDCPTINRNADEQNYIWIVREQGTWLCREERIGKFAPYTYCYNDKTARYYSVNIMEGEVKKIRDPRVFLSDALIKHPEWDEMEDPTW